MDLHGDRIDLAPLDPRADPERWERMVAAVMARARVPAAAAVVRSPLLALAAWSRPTLAAAAVVALISLGVLAVGRPAAASGGGGTVAETLEVPAPVQDWLVEDRAPERTDLLVALEEMPRGADAALDPQSGTRP